MQLSQHVSTQGRKEDFQTRWSVFLSVLYCGKFFLHLPSVPSCCACDEEASIAQQKRVQYAEVTPIWQWYQLRFLPPYILTGHLFHSQWALTSWGYISYYNMFLWQDMTICMSLIEKSNKLHKEKWIIKHTPDYLLAATNVALLLEANQLYIQGIIGTVPYLHVGDMAHKQGS